MVELGPCVSACGLYHCWHELLLWSASVLPCTVQSCRAEAARETMGFPLGVQVLVLFHSSFIGLFEASLLSYLVTPKTRLDAKDASEVWPLPL